ncbi:MAG: amidohydrolase family protein [Pseudomonadales bacterium]|nr:amidohydrolase family protein [Pseudomonadales bacterium]HJN53285.1 hypothetical protein [Pseudomonadales bacterium]
MTGFLDCARRVAMPTLVAIALTACVDEPQVVYSNDASEGNYHFINGLWFDGDAFVAREFFSVEGLLSSRSPETVVAVIDLRGGFVVPPFGEAHQHNVDADNGMLDELNEAYLKAGVFYVKNPNTLPRTLPQTLGVVNSATTIDATFSGGGVTGTDGHPAGIAQRNIDRGFWTDADMDGGFIYAIDDVAELEARWREIADASRDFVKTYLLYSEEYAKRVGDPEARYWKGLDPNVLPRLVELAHAGGLRVSTHVESATDFRNALRAGVDEINHMPGFRSGGPEPDGGFSHASRLNEEDARNAAMGDTVVVTTLGGGFWRGDVTHNLQLLHAAGVTLAVGTDSYEAPPSLEIESLHDTGIFSNLELLRMWSIDTPRTIFPARYIARLADGYEASFLVLKGNPIEDFDFVSRIRLGVKQGHIILREPITNSREPTTTNSKEISEHE